MQVRCPQCKASLNVGDSESLSNVSCKACGNAFSLLGEETLEFHGSTRRPGGPINIHESLAHFELETLLGMGAFGTVWKAHDTKLDRTVAIKIPRKDQLSRKEKEYFFREARAAAQLQHRNIVSVHEVGRDGDTVYIVSDYVEGLPLSKWLAQRCLSPNETAEICLKLAEALHHAHQCGVIHRDVKPSNIIVDTDGEPHIMDFGLAKRDSADATMTIEGYAFGTPSYMSPEQARGEAHHADCRTDIYSLGVIMFEMLTGEVPFRGGNSEIVMQKVLHQDAPHPRKLSSTIPDDLDTICWKCLEKHAQQRYRTCQHVADELQRFLNGDPIEARPITLVERAWRWSRRNRWIAGLAACFVLSLIIGLVGVSTQWYRAERNYERADEAANRAQRSAEREREAHRKTGHYLYVANMNLAQQAFEMGDTGRVLEILEHYRNPTPGTTDPRGFEWYYWWRQCHRWSEKFIGHTAPILAVDISDDGRRIASASRDGEIRVWDTQSSPDHITMKSEGATYSVAFSPDGDTIATGGTDQKIYLWDAKTGRLIKTLAGHDGTVFSLAFGAGGEVLVSGGSDTLVKVWNVPDGTESQTLRGHFDFVYSVAISRDGRRVASGGLDRTAIIWDASGGQRLHTLDDHAIEVWSVDFSPDASQLATGSGDTTVRTWDVQTGQLQQAYTGHTDRVRCVAYGPGGDVLASVGHDRSLRIWDLSESTETLKVPSRNLQRRPVHFFERLTRPRDPQRSRESGHTATLASVAFCANGKTIVTGGEDLQVVAWNVAELTENQLIDAHEGSVNQVVYSRDGQLLVSASNDKTVRLWDNHAGVAVGQPLLHDQRVLAVAISPDNQYVASGTFDQDVMLWDLQRGEPQRLTGHQKAIACVDFSGDGSLLASASHDHTIKLWNVTQQESVATLEGHTGRVYRSLFFDNGRKLASCSADQTVRIWDVESAAQLNVLRGHSDRVWALAISTDGRLLASGGEDRSIKLWSLPTGSLVQTIRGHIDLIQSLAFSPDGRTLASGSGDKTIRLWDVETGEPKTMLRGHDYRVWSLAFDPSGSTLASSSYKLRFWRTTVGP